MASLLSWAGNQIRRLENNVHNDVVAPVQRASGSVVHQAQGIVAQALPADGGRTYHTVMDKGAQYQPKPVQSALSQLTHNGATNLVGGVVKPLAQFPLDTGALAYNHVVAPAFDLPKQNLKQNAILGGTARYVGATGTPRQTLGSGIQTAVTLGTGGLGKGVEGAFTAVAPKVVPKLAVQTISRSGTGAIAGGGINAGAYVGGKQPVTVKGLTEAVKQGAQVGAVLGGVEPVIGKAAPVVAKGVVKTAQKAPETAKAVKYVTDKTDPRVRELDAQYEQLNKQWQTASTQGRKNIEKAITANRQARKENTRINIGASTRRVSDTSPAAPLESNRPVSGQPQSPVGKGEVSSSNAFVKVSTKPGQSSTQIQPESLPGRLDKIGTQELHQTGVSLANSTTLPETLPVAGRVRTSQSKLLKSNNITPEVKQALDPKYQSHSFTAQREQIAKNVTKNLTAATDTANRLVTKDPGTMTDAEHQFVSAVAASQDALGTKAGTQLAESLYGGILRHRTATGQTFAAFREMANNPNVLKAQASNFLKNKNIELKPEEKTQLDGLIQQLKATQLGTPERDMALHNVITFVTNKVPSTMGDKVVNFWRAGLLTSPITTGGNILGNTGEAVVRNAWVNPIATVADAAQSLVTGQRTKTMAGGQTGGGIQGAKQAGNYLKTGFDPNNPHTKFEGKGDVNYGDGKVGKAVGGYVNGVYRGLGAQDKPFRQAASAQAQLDLAKADAKNLKLSGKAKQDYIDAASSNPDWQPQTFSTVKDSKAAGAFAVFGNETVLGKVAQKIKEPITINGKTYSGAARQFILPFTQVPASIAMRIIHRSDLGATEIINQIMRVKKGMPYDQRAVSEAIGNGTFGPAAIGAGYALSKAGQITGNYPTDPKEKALWKSEGKQANSVRVGNRWYSMNYMQPFGTLLGIGDQMRQDEQAGSSPTDIVSNAAGRAAKSVESQSFLQGIDGLLSAVNDPQRSAKQYVNSTVSSVVPNIIRTTARATDPMQRTTNSAVDALKGTLPGVRESLPATQDMFGANLKAVDNPLNQLFNPLRPNLAKTKDPVVNELQRLQDTQNGIIPTKFDKNAIKGVMLNDQQVRQLNAAVNSKVKTAWQGIMADPRYQTLSDEDKATALKRAKDQIGTAYKRQFSADNNIASGLTKPASKSSVGILTGQKPDFISKVSASSSSSATPAEKYQTALDTYNKNKSTNSDIVNYAAQKSLAKMKVAAPFSNDVLKLYGMSKADAYKYLSTETPGVDKKKLADQLISYDKALNDAGLSKYLKYKTGIAPAAKKGRKTAGRKTKGGSKGTGKAGLATALSTFKATSGAAKPLKAPTAPHFTVKTGSTPSTYKQAALKKYAIQKPTVSKTKRA